MSNVIIFKGVFVFFFGPFSGPDGFYVLIIAKLQVLILCSN